MAQEFAGPAAHTFVTARRRVSQLSAILPHQEQAGEIAKNPAPQRAHVSATIGTETVTTLVKVSSAST